MSLESDNINLDDIEIIESLKSHILSLKNEIEALKNRYPNDLQLDGILARLDKVDPETYSGQQDHEDSSVYTMHPVEEAIYSIESAIDDFKRFIEEMEVRRTREDIEDALLEGGRLSAADLRGASWS